MVHKSADGNLCKSESPRLLVSLQQWPLKDFRLSVCLYPVSVSEARVWSGCLSAALRLQKPLAECGFHERRRKRKEGRPKKKEKGGWEIQEV